MKQWSPRSPQKSPSKSRVKSAEDKGLATALNFVKYRPRSVLEVVRRLQRAGLGSNEINSIIIQLTEVDILNDSRFARDWARSRDRLHPIGNWLLQRELNEKGVTEEVITRTLDERETPEWLEEVGLIADGRRLELILAEQLVQKRRKRVAVPEDRSAALKTKQHLAQFLGRRGFSPATISTLVFHDSYDT
ncbi:MAG: RecX family transcriptional regulator [bacterium]|nr:RecX family transcriptional regulator [bacterium]